MNEQQILDKLVAIVSPYVKDRNKLASLSPETNILTDLGVNSARVVDIVLAIEDTFDMEINDDDAGRVVTIGDGVKLISARVNGDN